MRIHILFITLLACQTKQQHLENEYKTAVENSNEDIQNRINELNGHLYEHEGNGVALIEYFCQDTLPKVEYFDDCPKDKSIVDLWIASSEYKNGLLKIDIGQIFFYENVIIEVKDNQIKPFYCVRNKDDKIFKLHKTDEYVKKLTLPIDIFKVELTKATNYIPGETIFGKLEITTPPYYEKENQYRRKGLKVFFKFKVRKSIEEVD